MSAIATDRHVLARPHRPRLAALVSLAVTAALLVAVPTPAESQPVGEVVDVMFLVDGSGSISAADWQLQKDGISAALQDQAAFPLDGSVAIGVLQWSSNLPTRLEVPLTVIDSAQSVQQLRSAIQGMRQGGAGTNPGDGVRAGTNHLLAAGRSDVDRVLCMSTDGTTNFGESLAAAVPFAQASGVVKYSVVAIEDPPFFFAPDFHAHYGPHVFGGGTVTVARNTAEFASLIIGSCINDPVELVGLEVNQSVQNWQNTIPVIAEKRTAVRAFVQVQPGGDSERVSGRLIGMRGGVELPGSPLAAINSGGAILAEEDISSRRHRLADSLNFVLPPSWTTGTVTLTFEGGGTAVICQDAAQPTPEDCSVTVTFKEMNRPGIRFVGVPYELGGTTIEPTVGQLWEQGFRAESLFPVPLIDISTRRLFAGFSSPPDLSSVNSRLRLQRFLDLCFSLFGCRRLYYGVLLGDAGGGLADGIPGTVSSGYNHDSDNRNDAGFFRNVGGHEIGHSLGLHHAVDDALGLTPGGLQQGPCGEFGAATAPSHPWFDDISGSSGTTRSSLLGPPGDTDTEVWGLDTRFVYTDVNRLAVVDPTETGALMGYCWVGSPQDVWTSAFEWDLLISGLEDRFGAAAAHATSGRHLLVSGSIDIEESPEVATLEPAVLLDGDIPVPEPGDYAVRLLDGAATVAEVSFEPIIQHARPPAPGAPEPPHAAVFTVPVLLDGASYTRIEVRKGADVIGALDASANAPTVSLTAPAPGSVHTGDQVTFSWTGTDPDGDPLTFAVRYSPDGGSTWETLAVGSPEESLTVARSALPASTTAVFQVIASDGVLSSEATSAPFTVEDNHPTIVAIASPLDGASFSGVQQILFEASAFDPEDGYLEGTSLQWTSDLDGNLGSGNVLTRMASDLRGGTHVVTVTASDTAGNTDQASVTIHVSRIAGPPAPPVGTPREQTVALIELIQTMDLHPGTLHPLTKTGELVLTEIDREREALACKTLERFVMLVDDREGKSNGLTSAQAQLLRGRAELIMTTIGC